MKRYVVFLMQWIVWSGYTLAEWLSSHDKWVFKAIMFVLFFQMAVLIARKILETKLQTGVITIMSLATYVLVQLVLQQILPVA